MLVRIELRNRGFIIEGDFQTNVASRTSTHVQIFVKVGARVEYDDGESMLIGIATGGFTELFAYEGRQS